MSDWRVLLVCDTCGCATTVSQYVPKDSVMCCGALMRGTFYQYSAKFACDYGAYTKSFIDSMIRYYSIHEPPRENPYYDDY